MKNKELKTLWKVAKLFWIVGTLFWIIETFIFLLIEGWHYKATNRIEILCDKSVSEIWGLALNITILFVLFFLINLTINKQNKNKKS